MASLPQPLSRRISVRARLRWTSASSPSNPSRRSAPWMAACSTGKLSVVRPEIAVSHTISPVAARTRTNLRPVFGATAAHIASF